MYGNYNKSIDYQGGGYGIGVLTREKPLRKEAMVLPGSEEQHSLLMVELSDCVIGSTHWSLKQPYRKTSVAVICRGMQKYNSKPVFLAGDFNAVPSSEEIREFGKEWTMLNDPASPTIPVKKPVHCIDYIWLKKDPKCNVKVLETRVEKETMASDHLPVWVTVLKPIPSVVFTSSAESGLLQICY